MAIAPYPLPHHQPDSWGRFRAMLEEVSLACSRAARRAESRDRAGLLMAAALLRIEMKDIDRSLHAPPRIRHAD